MSIEEKVLVIMKDLFEIETIDETCSQENCEAWDSLRHLQLVVELESEFEITLEPEEIGQMVSYADVVRIIKSK